MMNAPLWTMVAGSLLTACTPQALFDQRPPLLVAAQVSDSGDAIDLTFDEPLAEAVTGGDFGPEEPRAAVGSTAKVPLPPGLKPGRPYVWTAQVKDQGNNLTEVAGRFYGPNDHPATLQLNEVRVAGSGTKGDLVELRVTSPGSLGGWTLEAWSSPTAHQRWVFPDVDVEVEALVVVHYRPTGAQDEVDEVANPASSGGAEARPEAWDFWPPEAKGLSAAKGIIALRPRPDQAPVDLLVYAKTTGQGLDLASSLGWTADHEYDPSVCTPTRTWCRSEDGWMVVATGCATPGAPNRLITWEGPSSRRGSSRSTPRGTPPRSRGPLGDP